MEPSGGGARLLVIAALFVGFAAVLALRLYQIQVRDHALYLDKATAEHQRTIPIVPRRGAILDSEGHPLAISVLYDSVFVVGNQVTNVDAAVAKLGPILGLPPDKLRAEIDPQSNHPVLLKAGLPAATAAQVTGLGLDGVFLEQAPSRAYPEGSIAAQLLGFVGRDFHGLAGLEASLDDSLAGQQGEIQSEWDTTGREIVLARRVVTPATDGQDVVLTIDRYVQRTAEQILNQAVVDTKSSGGLIMVMDPKTGAMLAMASNPTYSLTADDIYDPNQEALYKPVWVTNQYEPGSVMKPITMSSAVDAKAVAPNSTMDDTGTAVIDGVVIHNWNGAANGTIDMAHILVYSSNVGAQWVAGRLGADRFYEYFKKFGFGQPTGVPLPGEAPGLLRDNHSEGWTRLDLATNSYGQGIAVTPLQMLRAIAAVGNDGKVMKPMLIKEYRGPNGHVVEPEVAAQAVSPEAARAVRTMMIQVLAQQAYVAQRIPGYVIAGKTGTADFATTAGYNTGKTYGSVEALLPADDPQLAILIRLDAPEGIYGGPVAVPVLRKLALALIDYYRIPPSEPVDQAAPPSGG